MNGISFGAELPVPSERAFAVVSDPTMWPRFFDSMRSAHVGPGWGRPGGTAGLVIRFMGRDVHSALELLEWDPPRSIRYIARQAGRPDLDNLRVIEPAGAGSRLVGTIRMTPRRGLRGAFDRLSLRVLQRVFDATTRRHLTGQENGDDDRALWPPRRSPGTPRNCTCTSARATGRRPALSGTARELVFRELTAYAEFGYRFSEDGLIPRLAAAEAAPSSRTHEELPEP